LLPPDCNKIEKLLSRLLVVGLLNVRQRAYTRLVSDACFLTIAYRAHQFDLSYEADMNRMTVLLSVTLAAVLYRPASQAQTATGPNLSGSVSTDTSNLPNNDASVPNAHAPDEPEVANAIRIVRLSQANGKVEMDRNVGIGFEVAFNNLPITQGARLKTSEGSAEVEFEDGTTLRLIPDTQVDFPELSRSAAGATLSSLNVLRGTVYLSLNKTKGNTFALTSGDGIIKPRPGSHLRLEVEDPESRLSIVSGTADFNNTAGSQEVGKMKSLIFNTSSHQPADLITGIEDASFDTWDEQQTEYRKRYSRGNALAGSGAAYGLADLNYYGSFSDVEGCGRIWRPYFASASWDPYASGIWALYPGSGYSWVSPYPWGWAPFHYGSWLQCGAGWGWQPGGGWYGLAIRDPRRDHDGHHHPHDPIHVHPFPPRPRPVQDKVSSMVAVNQKPLTFSHVDRATRSFSFRNDSAGLGIPRGEFGKLNKLSETAGKAGSSNVPLFFIPPNGTDLAPAGNGGLAARDEKASGAHVGDHGGFFSRPGNQNHDAHNAYIERGGGHVSDVQHGDGTKGSAGTQAAHSPSTAAGYAGSNRSQVDRGSNGRYNGSQPGGSASAGGYSGSSRNSGGYSGGPHSGNGPGYSGAGGAYSIGARSGGGNYSGGSGGSSGGSRTAGGGYSGAGGGGGSHVSTSTPSVPAPSAPSGHR
jgi:hypothetical protein